MKYPQLVSTRAVNAISDWLVSRLEQIGVEAPLIYSRLLLSLLHSSVQINDPIEFNNLETYLANRKGNKRIPPCDTVTLKKFTAVQCLMDAVSTEQEISNIENLVDELFEKLNDLEKKSNEEDLHQLPTTLTSLDIEDPRKRYYRAFPALSKEMEDSVWLSKRNVKALTWPTGNSGTSSSSMIALSNTAGVKRKTKRRRNQGLSKGRVTSVRKNSCGDNCSPAWDTDFEGNWEMGQDLIKEFLLSQNNNRNRSISESDACNLRYEENFEKRMKPMQYVEAVENYDIVSADDEEIEMDIKDERFSFKPIRANLHHKSAVAGVIKRDAKSVYCCNNDDENDNMTSLKEVEIASNIARRLYQRDDLFNNNNNNNELSSSSTFLQKEQQQNDFAQFEAKFNSSVEALWKNSENNIDDPPKMTSTSSNTVIADNVINPKNLENFWTNYYNHHYNMNSAEDQQRSQQFDNNNMNEPKTNDFFSMPTTFGNESSDKHKKKTQAAGDGCVSSSAGMFLQDSIWSDNSLSAQRNYDEDDSFYGSCWGTAIKNEGKNDIEVKDLPIPFSISKWSECSFETPFIPSSVSHESTTAAGGLSGGAKHDIRDSFLKNSYLYSSYKHPVAPATNKTATNSSLQQQSSSSSSQPLSLPDFYGSLRLSEHDYNKSSSSIVVPAALLPQPSPVPPTVSLTNHSKTSGFIEYSLVKPTIKIEPIVKIDRNNSRATLLPPPGMVAKTTNTASTVSPSTAAASQSTEEDENLLTSYRTHFRPIKHSYVDGHQFDISGSLDEVEFERSKTGTLYLDSEKYFEYTRDDMFVSDDDSSSIYSFNDEKSRDGRASVKGLHPLKFRVKQIDKQCQTEDLVAIATAPVAIVVDTSVSKTPRTNDAKIKYDLNEDVDNKDEVDFSVDSDCYLNEETSIDLDQWSMAEIGKKCVDNNNSHTLWGMCPACNKENKCVPANRLLKDELIIEADEIMSDLKYMQDLYICSDWEDDDDDDDGNDTDDSDLDALKHDDDCEVFPNEESADDDDDDDDQEQIFYNITKLISDLLKPENAKSLVDVLGGANQGKNIFRGIYPEDEMPISNIALHEHQKNAIWKNVNNNNNNINNNNNNNNNNNEKYIDGLWSNDENIIWKREMKPLSANIWPRIHDNKTSTFLDKLNWKHGNLAEIWNNGTTSSSKTAATLQNHSAPPPQSQHIDQKIHFNSRNLKNLLSWNISQGNIETDPQRSHGNCQTTSQQTAAAAVVNRADRKRRHSASQNISCCGSCGGSSSGSGGGGSIISDWHDNNSMIKIGNKIEIMAKRELDYSKLSLINGTSPATIITCKYWTTMDTTLASPYFLDKSSHYDGIGAMAMNPSSILKHVTVVSRPLTR